MRFNTPLRYPGGKGKLTPYLTLLFEKNELLDGHYVEPYAVGAGIALNLLVEGSASCIHLNDINTSVFVFWNSLFNHTAELGPHIRAVQDPLGEWN